MNVLLDTQAFLWLDNDRAKLSASAAKICADRSNLLWLSVASVWEMQIKIGLRKLHLQRGLLETISEQQKINGIQILPVHLAHVITLGDLPLHHKDPFDRLMIAQAKQEGWEIVSKDPEFKLYPVRVIW